MPTARYSVGLDFGDNPDPDHIDFSPYWIIAVISQGTLLTYSRKTGGSIFQNLANDPVLNASHPLVISDDCLSLSVSGNKRSPNTNFQATIKQTDTNYLTSIFPGDYLIAWMVNNQDSYNDLLTRISNLQPCNKFKDGLKFVGRVEDVRKRLTIEPSAGHKNVTYSLSAIGMAELQTYFFYDYSMASNDALQAGLGKWMARIGVDFQTIFGVSKDNTVIEANNINKILPTLLNLILGSGPNKGANIPVKAWSGQSVSATPTLASNEAPYAYVVPRTVGSILGKAGVRQPGQADSVMAFADILELNMGIQTYSNKGGSVAAQFSPDFDSSKSTPNRKITTKPMLGTFLPYMTEFMQVPLWSLFEKYLNPTINEMYATLRANEDGDVVPTVIFRQKPLTTNAFQQTPPIKKPGQTIYDSGVKDVYTTPKLDVTRFMDLPRWFIPNSMISSIDIGRSNATRQNFIHIYGSASALANNVSVAKQIVQNPPLRDDIDIIKNGMHPYMQFVECYVGDEVGRAPTSWMNLASDWLIGNHLHLTGTLQCAGIQSPICIGDALEQDGIVFMIEGVNHSAGIDTQGKKFFRTSLDLTNGLRVNGNIDNFSDHAGDPWASDVPIFAGILNQDQTENDPGLSLEGPRTATGTSLSDLPADSRALPQVVFDPKISENYQGDIKDLL